MVARFTGSCPLPPAKQLLSQLSLVPSATHAHTQRLPIPTPSLSLYSQLSCTAPLPLLLLLLLPATRVRGAPSPGPPRSWVRGRWPAPSASRLLSGCALRHARCRRAAHAAAPGAPAPPAKGGGARQQQVSGSGWLQLVYGEAGPCRGPTLPTPTSNSRGVSQHQHTPQAGVAEQLLPYCLLPSAATITHSHLAATCCPHCCRPCCCDSPFPRRP